MEPPINSDELPELPDELVEALREENLTLITSKVDREIAAAARRAFKSRKAPASKHRVTRWAAIAASVVAAVIVIGDMRTPRSLYADHDRSGQIDIADVFAVARDNDAYSQDDLDAFAMRIVSLDEDAS